MGGDEEADAFGGVGLHGHHERRLRAGGRDAADDLAAADGARRRLCIEEQLEARVVAVLAREVRRRRRVEARLEVNDAAVLEEDGHAVGAVEGARELERRLAGARVERVDLGARLQ